MSHHPNVLLLATGSVATIKLPQLATQLLTHGLNVQVVLTPTAERFLAPAEVAALEAAVTVWRDADEWARPWTRGDSVLHIELRKWADLLLVAPLSANSLAEMAGGLCAGLGMCVVRAWDTRGRVGDRGADGVVVAGAAAGSVEEDEGWRAAVASLGELAEEEGRRNVEGQRGRKMILVAPAMNTHMYLHPLTEQHLAVLRSWGWVRVLEPVEKTLACGDVGVGGMMEVETIVERVLAQLGIPSAAAS
ncbi:phosphopantothenoylcysteine decarboxylase [Geopyxis carbonaria]|nr:phosphopantothenoylcysteine decarboxylase [Geopyxis carbonaria]